MDRGRNADEREPIRAASAESIRPSCARRAKAARRGEAHDSAGTPTTTESFQLFLNQASKYPCSLARRRSSWRSGLSAATWREGATDQLQPAPGRQVRPALRRPRPLA